MTPPRDWRNQGELFEDHIEVSPYDEEEIVLEDDEETNHEDDAHRVSRLFYLQLYSSVLKAQREAEEEEKKRKKKKKRKKRIIPVGTLTKRSLKRQISFPQAVSRSFSWMDVTNLIPNRPTSNSTELERDVGDTFRPEMDQRRHYRALRPAQQMVTVTNNLNRTMTRNIVVSGNHKPVSDYNPQNVSRPPSNASTVRVTRVPSTLSRPTQSKKIEPVLNTRMKNLASGNNANNFTLRYRDRESVIEQKSYSCRAKRVLCSTLYISMATVAFVLVLFLLFHGPSSYGPFYETVYMADRDPTAKPKIGLCLPMPFNEERIGEMRINSQLASFLLYSVSPFFPNQDILDNQDLLTDLTNQYRTLMTRLSRGRPRSTRSKRTLIRLLRAVAPKCSEVITGCQIGTKQIIRGVDCCKRIFNRQDYSLQGLCFIAPDFTRISSQVDFPVTTPGTNARLTVMLNTSAANSVDVDHRIVPWDAARHNVVNAAVVHESAELSHRNARRDVQIRSGQTVNIAIKKRGVDNSSPGNPILGSCSKTIGEKGEYNSDELFGDALFTKADCRNSAIQLIAEKSVNCSLLSLPKIDKNLPACGPLEGLALMYILREQGSLVSINPKLLTTFEQNISEQCPVECYFQYFQSVISSYPMDKSTSQLFLRPSRSSSRQFDTENGAEEDMSIVEFSYSLDDFIRVRRYRSGILLFIHRLGSVCGCGLMILFICVMIKRAFSKRKGLLLKEKK